MNEQDLALIKKVKNDPDFPWKYVPRDGFYVENSHVYQKFTNSNGKSMRRVFRFGKYNMDGKYTVGAQVRGDFEVLVYSTEFI